MIPKRCSKSGQFLPYSKPKKPAKNQIGFGKRKRDNGSPLLSLGKYTKQNKKNLVGFKANFKLSPIANGTIYQVIRTAGLVWTEAWTVRKSGRKSPIDQNGTDSFLVARSDLEKSGKLIIEAVAWFEPGVADMAAEGFEQGESDDLWGTLWGHEGAREIPIGTQSIVRRVRLHWKKGGPINLEIL